MKKIIISLIAASIFIFTGCFADSDTATVKINLGNIPISKTAKVEKKSLIDRFLMIFAKEAVAQQVPGDIGVSVVHLGAFDENNKLLTKKSIEVTDDGEWDEPTYVEFDVPARSGVRIVVLGAQEIGEDENSNPIYGAGYYGCSEPLNLTAGEIEEVEVSMETLSSLFGLDNNKFNFRHEGTPENYNALIRWDRIYGVSKYILDYCTEQPVDPDDPVLYSTIYEGSVESCTNPSYEITTGSLYRIKLEFNFAKINSELIFINVD